MTRYVLCAVTCLLLLAGCHGGDGPPMTTAEYTIAADVDNAWITRQRKDAAPPRWARGGPDTGSAGLLSIGCWESYQERDRWRTFLRYAIDLPAPVRIISATLTITGDGAFGSGGCDAEVRLIDHADCDDITVLWPLDGGSSARRGENMDDLEDVDIPMLADPTPIVWTLPAGVWPDGEEHTSPNIETIIQAFVDRPGYVSGNYIGLLMHEGDAVGEEWHRFQKYDSGAGIAPVLRVSYTNFPKDAYESTLDALTGSHIGS